MAKTKPLPGQYGYAEKPSPRHPSLSCPACGSKADQDGYCSEPGCQNEGKTIAPVPPLFNDRRQS